MPTGGVSPPPAALGALGATVTQLVSEERYDEARECELHAEAAAQMEVLKGAYTAAKMDDNLEEAIHIRNQMTQLKDKMQPDAAVAAWQQPAADRTVNAMVAKAKQIFGDAEAAPFAASCATDLRALAASDLAAAAAEQKRARAGLELLLEVPPDAQKRHLANIGRLRAAVAKALTDGVSALEGAAALEPAERDGALRAPRVEALKHELVELRRLGGVLAASQARHAAVFVASAAAATPPSTRAPSRRGSTPSSAARWLWWAATTTSSRSGWAATGRRRGRWPSAARSRCCRCARRRARCRRRSSGRGSGTTRRARRRGSTWWRRARRREGTMCCEAFCLYL